MMLPAILIMTMAAVAQDAPPETPPAARAAASPGSSQSAIEAGLADFRDAASQGPGEFRQAVDADGNSAAAYFYLGYTVYKIAEPKHPFHPDKQKAAALFAKAYELDPAFQPAWGSRR